MDKGMKGAIAAGVVAAGTLIGAAAISLARRHTLQVVRMSSGSARVHMVESEDGCRARVLSQGGVFQSATYLDERRFDPVFAYIKGFDACLVARPQEEPFRVLVVGGGGFSYPKHLLSTQAPVALDVIEPEPAIIRAARSWFFLDELERTLTDESQAEKNSLRIFAEEGRALLERGCAQVFSSTVSSEQEVCLPHYHAIIVDAFAGAQPVADLHTVEGVQVLASYLEPGGVHFTNVALSQGGDYTFLRNLVSTMREVYKYVHVIAASDPVWSDTENYIVAASNTAYAFDHEVAYDDEFLGTSMYDGDAGGK
ncbi:fused MFS/spermidine synthase [Collinsella sp. AGMB00827]|uniref:Fused MFS/spermidine synthase n=1 Tax=Collinsella ureilytica TaxID=2869515 RepID=A0ABS7MLQ4_9ACTN|nr:fused MFS/spermidine synthase [Collinsella urealyticum]MBY4798294.1 fused MFS/spermidine synthase [Collinsella urealyticum]